jgi:hypothetical protein
MAAMRIVDIPESNDVLCGKDKTFNRNIGNITYRQLIVATAVRYAQLTTKPEKMKITAQIVHTMMHQHKSRFLKQIVIRGGNGDYYWQEITTTAARDKTSHALRFCAAQMMQQQTNSRPNAMRQYTYDDDLFDSSLSIPITPPLHQSVHGRPQRFQSYGRGSTSNYAAIPTLKVAKRTHRRTVSNEIAVPLLVTSSIHDIHRNEETPVPMECKSAPARHHRNSYQDEDIEAILREPLRWEDAMGDDDECYEEENVDNDGSFSI